eukprot:1147900-Pelagomonas_calceolata.AAC.5
MCDQQPAPHYMVLPARGDCTAGCDSRPGGMMLPATRHGSRSQSCRSNYMQEEQTWSLDSTCQSVSKLCISNPVLN